MTKYFAFSDTCTMLLLRFATLGEKKKSEFEKKEIKKFEHGRRESDATQTASHLTPCKQVTVFSLVISLGTPSGGPTLLQRSQRVGACHALFSRAEIFASGHTAFCTVWYFQFTYILEVTEGVRCEPPLQSPYRTKLELQKRVTKNESKVNNHNFMICMGAKVHS